MAHARASKRCSSSQIPSLPPPPLPGVFCDKGPVLGAHLQELVHGFQSQLKTDIFLQPRVRPLSPAGG